jgi:hypothetical protein
VHRLDIPALERCNLLGSNRGENNILQHGPIVSNALRAFLGNGMAFEVIEREVGHVRRLSIRPTVPNRILSTQGVGENAARAPFLGQNYDTLAEIARAFGENWPEARSAVERGHLLNWVKDDLRDNEWRQFLSDLDRDCRDLDERIFRIIVKLDPKTTPAFCGYRLDPDGLQRLANNALANAGSARSALATLFDRRILVTVDEDLSANGLEGIGLLPFRGQLSEPLLLAWIETRGQRLLRLFPLRPCLFQSNARIRTDGELALLACETISQIPELRT